MTTHRITTDQLSDQGYCIAVDLDMRLNGRGHNMGFSPEGRPGRKVFEGPLHPELFGWLNESATVIAAHKIAGPPRLDVAVGDVLEVEGHGSFTIVKTPGPWSRITLEVIA